MTKHNSFHMRNHSAFPATSLQNLAIYLCENLSLCFTWEQHLVYFLQYFKNVKRFREVAHST